MNYLEKTLDFCISQRDNITRTLSLLDLPAGDSTRTLLESRIGTYASAVGIILSHLDKGLNLSETTQGIHDDLSAGRAKAEQFCAVDTSTQLANMNAYEYFFTMSSTYLDIIEDIEDGRDNPAGDLNAGKMNG